MGSPPSNPQLLDWLAATLRDNGGSIKALHRLIELWDGASEFTPLQIRRVAREFP